MHGQFHSHVISGRQNFTLGSSTGNARREHAAAITGFTHNDESVSAGLSGVLATVNQDYNFAAVRGNSRTAFSELVSFGGI